MYHSQPLLHLGKNGGHVLFNKNLINSLEYVQFGYQIRSTGRVTCPLFFPVVISPVELDDNYINELLTHHEIRLLFVNNHDNQLLTTNC